MAKLKFTARTLAALKPDRKRIEYFDESLPGFFMRVTPSGIKTFGVLYRIGNHLRRYTIGTTHQWTLAAAREEAREALRSAAKGADPALKKKANRTAETFEQLVEVYLVEYASKKRSERENRRILTKYFLPELRHVRAKDVSRAQIRTVVNGIATGGAPIMGNRALAAVRKMYNWAVGEDIVEHSPCFGLLAPSAEQRRDRVLSDEEIKKVWNALETETSAVADTFKLRFLTLQRGGEVLGMRWSEIDMESRWWTIPSERSKNKLPHRVWLSDSVMRILEAVRDREQRREKTRAKRMNKHPRPVEFVFPGRRHGKPLQETKRVLDSLRTESSVDNWIGYDLRRTAASNMAAMGIPRLTVSRILNHAEPGVTAVYDRHSYDNEKREALEKWARRLMVIVSDIAIEIDGFVGSKSDVNVNLNLTGIEERLAAGRKRVF